LVLFGCGEEDPTEPTLAPPERIENPDLRIAITDLPGGFDLVTNAGARLELAREPGLPPGRAWVEVGPPVEGAINLIEIIRDERQAFEALPGGSFSGNGELVLPDGRPAYYSRGRFQDEGTLVEEFRVRAVHPVESDRLLLVFYRYPAGEDSAQRLEDVLYLVGEIEGLEGPEESAAGPTAETPP
ncbi:MAG TPA: hypothetical protein VMS86_12980, partial [Thermoanaerobaculia bacterium]|nr:hypothetical protein [Thermoanaerobaculia bacterium]